MPCTREPTSALSFPMLGRRQSEGKLYGARDRPGTEPMCRLAPARPSAALQRKSMIYLDAHAGDGSAILRPPDSDDSRRTKMDFNRA